MTEKEKLACFNAKANDSFRAKMRLYLFDLTIRQAWDCFNEVDFAGFEISQSIVDLFTSEYFQELHDYKINGLTISEIYQTMKSRESEFKDEIENFRKLYINTFEDTFSRDEFYNLLDKDECEYCGINLKEIESLAENRQLHKKVERGWKLEIDRKNSNLEYKPDNCVMACYWCNNAKTDEFSYDEFKSIGKEIRKIWEQRLLVKNYKETEDLKVSF